jgi:hypothetical protein
MFADPQTVTINAVPISLPRVGTNAPNRIGNFLSQGGTVSLSIHQNQTANRCRREYRLTQRKIAVDPISSVNKEVSASVIIAIDSPKVGFDNTELGYLVDAVKAAFTNTVRDKLLGGEL